MHRRTLVCAMCALMFSAPFAAGAARSVPVQRNVIVTAYYSPLPDQCCYLRGSFEADRVLNGDGLRGADGTLVYAGMAAAPSEIPFGTRIALSGIGTVTVHDRGGAIATLPDGTLRLDLWAGAGEEGLARALAFGVQHTSALFYPLDGEQPAESIALGALPAPIDAIRNFIPADDDLLVAGLKPGDTSVRVAVLQERLAFLGYFRHPATGFFGDVTADAVHAFQRDAALPAADAPISPETAAHLAAAFERRHLPVSAVDVVHRGSPPDAVMAAKRLLRGLGYYHGRTTPAYDHALFRAIFAFQRDNGIVAGAQDSGAGQIGPQTRAALARALARRGIARRARILLARARVRDHVVRAGRLPTRFLERGDSGVDVVALQRALAARAFFPAARVNGAFGPQTEEAVIAYQIARGIIADTYDPHAGVVGPMTLLTLRSEEVAALEARVRADGWRVL